MSNRSGKAYALTTLCPIRNGHEGNMSFDKITRHRIQLLEEDCGSPFARIPNTYFARLFILNDVFFEQGNDVHHDHLKSKYLVFTSNFHGDLKPYLKGMWDNANDTVHSIWEHAVAFDKVRNSDDFIAYIRKCQLTTSLFFNGSTDDELRFQLKSLYIKQAFSEFVLAHQNKSTSELRTAFNEFMQQMQPDNLNDVSWIPGQTRLSHLY